MFQLAALCDTQALPGISCDLLKSPPCVQSTTAEEFPSGYAGACQCLLLHKNGTKTGQQLITAQGDHVCLQFKDLPLSLLTCTINRISHNSLSITCPMLRTPQRRWPWLPPQSLLMSRVCTLHTHLCWHFYTLSKSHGRAKQSCSSFLCSFPLPTVNVKTLLLFK